MSVGCFITLAPYYLPALFSECTSRYPGIEIDVVEAEAEHLLQVLRACRVRVLMSHGESVRCAFL
ncbi:LysR substrate-binding domain-containing protein [Streptomyces sp. NBC_01197]|uniref:LysR substrate-binding domain-containing protein n=1 Tax=Streptomyces sp. NBC_01197 TaxID=2903768 RepID=UPI002E1454B9|nr:LysR substrate-binding domain-containing protein [Streptomyces sp. NBC_01197]